MTLSGLFCNERNAERNARFAIILYQRRLAHGRLSGTDRAGLLALTFAKGQFLASVD